VALAQAPKGVLPLGADGKPLNLDFETGTLADWTATGDAFNDQPIKGEIDQNRVFGEGKRSRLQGEFWIGGYEKHRDKPTGTLTSVPFKVTHPFAAFRVGGGRYPETRVELVRKDSGKPFLTAHGEDLEDMLPIVVDLRLHVGHEIFIRIVDQHTGGWGHVNFDDFRFYDGKPFFERTGQPARQDNYEHAGLAPDAAAKAMTLPPGFRGIAFAGEPDVHQPIAQAIDDRGRLWIAEAYEYPIRAKGDKGRDRILIFEDTDNDGKFNKRTVFMEGLNLVSGMELGFGGVYIGAAPYLMFVPDKNGDDKPDGPPQILLDGWAYQDTHETLNSFIWGPDGWLYGCHGVFTHSRVGKPGVPLAKPVPPDEDKRVPINAGYWRYHPTKHVFEVFAHGTSNPWGLDFDEYGNAFATACVIPHLYHIIQGGRYERQAGEHFNKFTYDDIKTIADHRHYVGANPHGGNNRSDEAGGGHAHAACMIYQGGVWPKQYHGKVFMNNIHGQRINMDILVPQGSGFVGRHGPDFCLTNDRWSQIINLQYGPDGNVYMIDWYDANACHHGNVAGHDRTNGRIFKIVYEGAENPYAKRVVGLDLKKLSDLELATLALEKNEWYVRHAIRLLQERAASRAIDDRALLTIRHAAQHDADAGRRLRGHWALHAASKWDGPDFVGALKDANPALRAWGVRLVTEKLELDNQWQPPRDLWEMIATAAKDPSPVVRLQVAARAQRIRRDQHKLTTKDIEILTRHADDAKDQNLPFMYWYALEPLVAVDSQTGLRFAGASGIKTLLGNTVRRIVTGGEPQSLSTLIDFLAAQDSSERQLIVLSGMNTALQGRRKVEAPKSFAAVYAKLARSSDPKVQSQLRQLAVTFGDASVQDAMRGILADGKADAARRAEALSSLLKAKDQKLPDLLLMLLAESELRGPAVRALAAYDDPRTPTALLTLYSGKAGTIRPTPDEKRDILTTLSSRLLYAKSLLHAVADKTVPAGDLSADLVRQLRNFNDDDVNRLLNEHWGNVRDTAADKRESIVRYTKLLTSPPNRGLDISHGRAVFAKTCQQCHTLFGAGNKIGPDLTGSNRANLEYLLSNVLDPSAVMAKEYLPSLVRTVDGRQLTAIVKSEDANAITLQTEKELLVLPKEEIDERKLSDKSMMPDDLLKPLSDDDVRDLAAYLANPRQVPIAATPENVAGFFNGKDLTGWTYDPKLWSVENGEIVGRATSGLKHNDWIKSDMLLYDFHFKCQVKLVKNEGNSGIQFRSEVLPNGEVKGYQADIGVGWWGKLYEEHGRALLWDKSGEKFVKPGEWNTYEIIADGGRVRTLINGNVCVDIDDPKGARRGIIAFQLHSGGPTEVRYKDLAVNLEPRFPSLERPSDVANPKVGRNETRLTPEQERLLALSLRLKQVPLGSPEAVEIQRLLRENDDRVADALRTGVLAAPVAVSKADYPTSKPLPRNQKIRWKKTTLDQKFRSEGVCAGDFNNDKKLDIAAGNVWFEAPSWKMHHILENEETFNPKVYSKSFVNAAEDVNGDGWHDLVVVDFPGAPTWWFENPQKTGVPWKKHMILPVTNNESPHLIDLDGDKKLEVLCGWLPDNFMGYARRNSAPAERWALNPISTAKAPGTDKFWHGLGVGDVNNDGRNDVIITGGWWERPKDVSQTPWKFHKANFGKACSQMYAYDFDGDGDNDILSTSAHDFGIWWHEKVGPAVPAEKREDGVPRPESAKGVSTNDTRPSKTQTVPPETTWTTHTIDKSFSETHATVLADINGDGLADFVTGKRWWSHGGGGPGGNQPAVLYWFELTRNNGRPEWVRHEIDPEQSSGVGTAFEVADLNSDGLLDIVISNKKGSFYFEQVRE
jgi:putative membrane-bound dehydrogenase-like protein